ncbi:MAG: ABC transporter ATP-binding protein [Dictyoglomus sp.]|jgi:peptide/nickel transport system ATP-binding protein|uniref:ABC transporter ATP-binding protein n=1 Tax=Dictyoglomus sp. TaxID=28205 RepID=UPI003D0A6908
MESILKIEDLYIDYRARRGLVKAVRGVSLEVYKRETLGIIGESGSGKTTLGLSIIKLLPSSARISQGKIWYQANGKKYEVISLDGGKLRKFRWKEIAMVFQSALNAFNPVIKIWDHILDTVESHDVKITKEELRTKVLELLRLVQLDPERVLKSYPHELSGGMRQRVLIALALLLDPQIVILDEPTTALDILSQRSILELLKKIKKKLDLTIILISHDLSLAAELADRVAVMYAGSLVEVGSVYDIFYRPLHPYTLGLIKAVPTVSTSFRELISIPGSPPDLIDLPPGCKFHPRCEYKKEECLREEPKLVEASPNHYVACYRWEKIKDGKNN